MPRLVSMDVRFICSPGGPVILVDWVLWLPVMLLLAPMFSNLANISKSLDWVS